MFQMLFENFNIISTVLSAAAILLLAWLSTKFVSLDKHERLAERVDDIQHRVERTEMEMKHLPDIQMVQLLTNNLIKLEGEIKAMLKQFESIEKMMDRMQAQADRMETFLKDKM